MAKTRTMFAAVVAVLGFAGTANAQSIDVTIINYQPAQPPQYPQATTQPGGSFILPNLQNGQHPDHRVVIDYGIIDPTTGNFTSYADSPNPGLGNPSRTKLNPVSPGRGGTFNWGVPGPASWTPPAPTAGTDQVRAKLQKRVANTGNDATDWSDVAEKIKPVR